MARNEIPALQYIRGLAATAVVLDHANAMMSFSKYFGFNCGGFWNFGATGVNIFFIISGFIITFTSLKYKVGKFEPSMSLKDFALKRFTRIVPIMWIAIATYFIGREIGRDSTFNFSYIRAFFLIPFGSVEPNNIWTLRHEAIFYSLFALSLLPLKPKPWILGVWALSPLAYAVLSLPQSPSTPWLQFVRIVTNPCNIEFATGVAIGLAWHKWTNSWEISLPLPSGITILAVFALFWTLNYEINVGVDTLYACAISSLTGGLIVFLAIHLDCTAGYLERLLSYLGEASFSIYLFHPHFTSAMLGLWSKHFRATPAAVVLVGTSVVAVIGAVIIYEYIERPVHRLAFRFLSKRL